MIIFLNSGLPNKHSQHQLATRFVHRGRSEVRVMAIETLGKNCGVAIITFLLLAIDLIGM